MLSNQFKYLIEKDNKIIRNVISEYTEEIRQSLKKMEYPTNIIYRCTGGGSLRFSKLFEDNFKAHIDKDAIWENVRGLHLMGKVVWGI